MSRMSISAPALATNYSVTVLARAVNVNAVTAQTNGVVQDYALVISGGDGQVADALTVTDESRRLRRLLQRDCSSPIAFPSSQGISGALLLNQRVGAQAPLADGNTVPWPGGPTASSPPASPTSGAFTS